MAGWTPETPPADHVESIVERERQWHDSQEFRRGTAALVRTILKRSIGEFNSFQELFDQFDAEGRDALDYGCGRGYITVRLAEAGAKSVTGIDLSVAEIDDARQRAADHGVADRITFIVGDAHHSPFPDASFDLIVGAAILHHLDLETSLREVKRLLRPGGEAVFIEPLWHNPILRLGRRLSPSARTEDEHPLTTADWQLCASIFPNFTHTERELLTTPLMPLNVVLPHRGQAALARAVKRADRRVIERFPSWSKYSRVTFLHLRP